MYFDSINRSAHMQWDIWDVLAEYETGAVVDRIAS